jgi:multiple antibiotic resistance protein
MIESFESTLQFSVVALSSIFFLVDPFAAIPSFLAMTALDDDRKRRVTARRAAITCFIVLSAFALVGSLIFKMFGITLPAFEIAGGMILLLVGLEMLQAKRSQTQEVSQETTEGTEKDDPGVLPLGIPMLAGPGAISTVMVLMGPSTQLWKAIAVFAAIALTSLLSYIILAAAIRVRGFLGETGIRIMMRLMGLLLTAIAVQFMINGLVHLKVLKAG